MSKYYVFFVNLMVLVVALTSTTNAHSETLSPCADRSDYFPDTAADLLIRAGGKVQEKGPLHVTAQELYEKIRVATFDEIDELSPIRWKNTGGDMGAAAAATTGGTAQKPPVRNPSADEPDQVLTRLAAFIRKCRIEPVDKNLKDRKFRFVAVSYNKKGQRELVWETRTFRPGEKVFVYYSKPDDAAAHKGGTSVPGSDGNRYYVMSSWCLNPCEITEETASPNLPTITREAKPGEHKADSSSDVEKAKSSSSDDDDDDQPAPRRHRRVHHESQAKTVCIETPEGRRYVAPDGTVTDSNGNVVR